MDYIDTFIDNNLPKKLSEEELSTLFLEYKNGSLTARDKIIIHNIKLVIYLVNKNFSNTRFDRRELVATGLIGLIKSVDAFDIDKNNKFATYAVRCINNEILAFINRESKIPVARSLNEVVNVDNSGKELVLEDILEDNDADFVSDYENRVVNTEIRKVISNLPDRDRKIVLLYFGFIDDCPHSQAEIASIFKISPTYVSRIVTKAKEVIGYKLKKAKVVENTEPSVYRCYAKTKKVKFN